MKAIPSLPSCLLRSNPHSIPNFLQRKNIPTSAKTQVFGQWGQFQFSDKTLIESKTKPEDKL